jgi:enoyl-CoA hydratase/carnithine racemase
VTLSKSQFAQLESRQTGQVAVVTFSNPGRANSLSNQTLGEDLPRLLTTLGGDDEVRAVVFTGAGDGFCAGSELDADGFSDTRPAHTIGLLRSAHRSIAIIRAMPKPCIAAVNGAAIGAGLGLALACDVRIASRSSRFGTPYARMGLTPDMGVSFLLREVAGLANALELVMTGQLVNADAARAMGIVSRVVSDPLTEALALASKIAGNPPAAVLGARALVLESARRGLEWSLSCGEPQAFAATFHHDQFREQFAAYRAGLAARARDRGAADGQ